MYFQSQVFVVALLLSLTAADPTPDECVQLNQTLSAEELPTIFGKWIMHEAYGVSDNEYTLHLRDINSSLTELISSENNQAIIMKQAFLTDDRCTRYSVNLTVVGNAVHYSGLENTTAKADFLKTCDDCLMLRYNAVRTNGIKGTYLLFYGKTKELPQADQERAREQARCLGFTVQPPEFIYTQTELCPEQSDADEAKEPEQ